MGILKSEKKRFVLLRRVYEQTNDIFSPGSMYGMYRL